MIDILASYVLVALAVLDWWSVAVAWHLWRISGVAELRKQRNRFGLTALAATSVAALALNFLLGLPLGRGADFVLLVAGLVLASGPCLYWLLDYYRR